MMVGGINKQIYLPYQLAQSLGFYKKYGVNMVLSNEVAGGVGAETAMASGQVDMAGAWYVHTINFQLQGKSVVDVAQLSGSPGERIMCATGTHITSPAQWKGQSIGVTDLGSGTDQLTQYLAARYGLKTGDYTTDRGRRRLHHDRRAAAPQDPLRHDHPADGRGDREAGRRLPGVRPHHHRRGAEVARRLHAHRRRARR